MTRLDDHTQLKLREMGAVTLLYAIEQQDDALTLGVSFEERVRIAVDDAHAAHTQAQVDGLIRRAKLRYPHADLRTLDLMPERGIDPAVIAQLATCSFIQQQRNVVFQGPTGSGKSFLGSALGRAACQHRHRVHYIRMPDLESGWAEVKDKPGGTSRFLNKYASPTAVVILDEWLLQIPRKETQQFLLELVERRYDTVSTIFCTQYAQKDWHQRLGGGVLADAIMDRIVHHTSWIETGSYNMREHVARQRR